MTADELKAALADGVTHVKTWGTSAEKGCIEMVHKLFHKDGTEVASITHNYLDDIKPADLPGPDAAGTETPTADDHAAAATAARVDELTAAGHPDPVGAATTPVPSKVDATTGAPLPPGA